MAKLVGGVLLFFLGIALGLYVGFWWGIVGGIETIFEGAHLSSSLTIAWGIVRFIFASAAGYLSAAALIIPSLIIMAAGFDEAQY